MDIDLFLTAQTLQLTPDVTTGQRRRGVFAIKSPSARGYLTVDERHAMILNQFAEPRTVPEVLEISIRSRICVPLREFYDLVLKAYAVGILRVEGAPAPEGNPAIRWPLRLWPKVALTLLPVGAAAATAALLLLPLSVPTSALDVLIGYGAVAGAWSAGYLVGSSVLRSADGEVYHPRLRFRYGIVPHFAVDLSDSCMSAGPVRAAVQGSPALPLCYLVLAACWLRQPWVMIPAAAFYLECLPLPWCTAGKLIHLLRRKPLLATDRRPRFKHVLPVREVLRLHWRRFDGRVMLLQILAALAWVAGIAVLAGRQLQFDSWAVLRRRETWVHPALGTATAIAVIALLSLARLSLPRLTTQVAEHWRRLRQFAHRWTCRKAVEPHDLHKLVRRNPLVSRMDPEAQAEFISQLRLVSWKPWERLMRFEEQPREVAVIVRGVVKVYRRLPSGRSTRFLRLEEGDIFGAHRLVDKEHAELEVRTASPVQALVIPADEFARLVVSRLGADTVRHYLHTQLFLQRVSHLCRGWRPAAVARFSELARATFHSAGGKLITHGQEVHSLYVLYKGRARATRDARRIGTIRPGDVVGEISLLQAGVATATVESNEPTQWIQVNRVEFIRFLARNHHVALAVERICKDRLGDEVFVADGHVFSVR